MADDVLDPHEQFVSAMEAKYSANDEAERDAQDGVTDTSVAVATAGDGAGKDAASETDDEGDAEHTAPGTSAKPDGAAAESGEESADDDDAEHTDDADDTSASDDSADDDTATDEGDGAAKKEEEDEDPETAIAEDTKALLAAKGADLSLDDVPEEHRPVVKSIVDKKLRGIDQAFSRVQQERTAFRAEQALFEAEQRFQLQHPELLIADLLRKHPELEGKVIEAGPNVDDAASMSAFDKKVADSRKQAQDDVNAAHEAMVQAHQRADQAVASAMRLSAAAGLEFELVEPALILAVQAKPKGEQDLTDEEMAQVIAKTARLLKKPVRQALREQSREKVKQRTERRIATAVPARAAATPSKPVVPAPPKKAPINYSDEDARRDRMMESVREILPGRK